MSGSFDAAFLLKKVKKSLKKILTGCGACCILLCILNALAEGKMKTKNKVLISLLSVSFIVGGSIAIIACQQNVSPNGKVESAAGSERKAVTSTKTYTFIFNNGYSTSVDCIQAPTESYVRVFGGGEVEITVAHLPSTDKAEEWAKKLRSNGIGAGNMGREGSPSQPGSKVRFASKDLKEWTRG
jgi:hypothetical protein